MKSQSFISKMLLAFVAVSFGMATLRATGVLTRTDDSPVQGSQPGDASASTAAALDAPVKAVFFHSEQRCDTCRKIEKYAHSAFSNEIERGEIAWEVRDFTAPENARFVELYDLVTSTVVLVRERDGKPVRWLNLQEVWSHTDDPEEFSRFVHERYETIRKDDPAS
jgi:hypothetical protein